MKDRELHYDSSRMRRAAIALVWIAAATLPLLLATVFLFGCCVLPFHGVIHRLMPICSIAANVLRGHDADPQQVPPREKQEPVKRLVTETPNAFRLTVAPTQREAAPPTAASAYRSFISLGAVRCDHDVGLHLLVETFRI